MFLLLVLLLLHYCGKWYYKFQNLHVHCIYGQAVSGTQMGPHLTFLIVIVGICLCLVSLLCVSVVGAAVVAILLQMVL